MDKKRVNFKIVFALFILATAAAVIMWEYTFIQSCASEFGQSVEKMINCAKNGDIPEAEAEFNIFVREYHKKEALMSFFLHDRYLDETKEIIDSIEGLFSSGSDEELFKELEELSGKIAEIGESILPNLRNIM